jgi:5-formyltetrahydrofolate cyclo-ligase
LSRLAAYRQAKEVLCYVSVREEVDTRPLLRRIVRSGRRLSVPVAFPDGKLVACRVRNLENDLKQIGLFGIPRPAVICGRVVKPKDLDLVILPGVAFDPQGHRLGRGKGYFDRYLKKLPGDVWRVALAFETQIVKKIPSEPHDQRVCRVVTEKRVIQ